MTDRPIDRADVPEAPAPRWPHALATLAFAGLAVAAALTRSETPTVLGRYSKLLFAYEVGNVATLALLLAPARWGRVRWAGYGLAVASTFLAPINEAVRQLPGIQAALPIVRLLIAWAIVAVEFDRFRRRRPVRGLALGVGFALAALSILDLALWAWVAATSGFDEDYGGYRDRYDMASVTPNDVVIVGDSFVWGHGVAKAERFGDVLQSLYAREGRPLHVYSLGVRGAGLSDYLGSLARVTEGRKAGAVIVSFYPNDLPPRPKPRPRAFLLIERATWALGRSSLTFRGLHDLLGRIESPNLGRYHQSVIDDYRRDDPTFPARWAELTASLDRIARSATERSRSKPILLILPLMVDFRAYPLADAHTALRATAERLGFDVLDVYPAFSDALGDGAAYRVRPGDNHFDARAHALVAELLKRHLDSRSGSSADDADGRR
jgi:hypothetical protein